MQHLLADLGDERTLSLLTDSTAAKGAAFRLGVGKRMKHIEVQDLWLQHLIRSKKCKVGKVWGHLNPADLATKHVDQSTITRLLEIWSCVIIKDTN